MLPVTKPRITRVVPSPFPTTARETSPWITSPMIPKPDMSGFPQLTLARCMWWTLATVPFARSRALPQTKLNWAAESAVRGPAAYRLVTEWCTSATAPIPACARSASGLRGEPFSTRKAQFSTARISLNGKPSGRKNLRGSDCEAVHISGLQFVPSSHEWRLNGGISMLMQIVVYATLFNFAMVSLSSAQGMRPNDVPILTTIESPGVQSQLDATRPTQTLLTEIVTWLSANFDLPAIQDHPSVEFVS